MNIRFTNREKQPPDVSHGMKVPYAPGRRVVVQWRWWLILTLVTSPFLYLLYKMILPFLIVTAPGLIVLEKETLVSVTESAVERIHVRPGDRVRRGQVLAELVAPKLGEQIEVLQTMLEPVGSSFGVIALYRQQEQQAVQTLTHQEERLSIASRLFTQGAATAAEVNAVRSQLDGARHTLIQAQLERTKAEQQALAPATAMPGGRQDRQHLQQQLANLLTQQQQLTIRAAHDGTVLELLAERGKVLAPGEGVVVVGLQEQTHILAYIQPDQVKRVPAGTHATVSVSGGPSLQAKVLETPSQARRLPAELSSTIGTRDIMVLVTLDPIDPLPAERAIEGLPVNVRFHHSW